jgi:hypothetical protein
MIRHEYVEYVTLTSTAGALASYQFSCNGMFDPNITGTGHQPMYFDNMAAMYDHYTVFRSHLTLEVLPTSADMKVALYIDDDTSTTATVEAAGEMPTGTSTILSHLTVRPRVFRLTWDGKKTFGGDLYDNDNLQGNSGANPSEQSYFTLKSRPLDQVTDTSILFKAQIIYEAVWDELVTQALN